MIGIENTQHVGVFFRVARKIVMAGLIMPFSALTRAEVTLDGTLGPAGSLAGPNFVIPDTVGQTVGTNLFHSFGLFNINTGESATFTGPAAIENVISRVTGGSRSFIDGPLRSEIESANLWFINPAGVLFGQHASLDIQGSFHVSTADYLKLGDGGQFEATHPENSVLTTAPPEAFGFLGENPAGIAFHGSGLSVPEDETLSVIGGDIEVTGGARLQAPGGRVNMASAASAGEVRLEPNDLSVDSFDRLGRIEMNQGTINMSGEGGGSIFIRGGQFMMEDSHIHSNTRGGKNGEIVSVKAENFQMRNEANISTTTEGSGRAGEVFVEADHVLLDGEESQSFITGIFAETFVGGGDAGSIRIKAGDLEMRSGALISTTTFGSGRGGDVRVEADHVLLDEGEGTPLRIPGTGIEAGASSFIGVDGSAGGSIEVKAGDLQIRNGAGISTSASGPGPGGDVRVEADNILLDGGLDRGGKGGGIFAGTFSGSSDAGSIEVKAGDLQIRNGARISTSTSGPGSGSGPEGDVRVEADHVLLDGGDHHSLLASFQRWSLIAAVMRAVSR